MDCINCQIRASSETKIIYKAFNIPTSTFSHHTIILIISLATTTQINTSPSVQGLAFHSNKNLFIQPNFVIDDEPVERGWSNWAQGLYWRTQGLYCKVNPSRWNRRCVRLKDCVNRDMLISVHTILVQPSKVLICDIAVEFRPGTNSINNLQV